MFAGFLWFDVCAIFEMTSGTGHNLGPLVICYSPRAAPLTPMETALSALLLASIGALGALVERIRRELVTNTHLTEEAKAAANGNLREALAHLATERNKVLGLRAVVREREDRLAYIIARLPEAESILVGYTERRQQRASEREEAAVMQRLSEEWEPEDAGT